MTEEHTGEQKSTKVTKSDALADALKLVNAEVDAVREHLERISKTEKAVPVAVECTTSTYYNATAWVDPSPIAKIMLDYNYHYWHVLGQDAPDGMWDEIAELIGVESVMSVDISLSPVSNTETD